LFDIEDDFITGGKCGKIPGEKTPSRYAAPNGGVISPSFIARYLSTRSREFINQHMAAWGCSRGNKELPAF
jgi:hypothetical protein